MIWLVMREVSISFSPETPAGLVSIVDNWYS